MKVAMVACELEWARSGDRLDFQVHIGLSHVNRFVRVRRAHACQSIVSACDVRTLARVVNPVLLTIDKEPF